MSAKIFDAFLYKGTLTSLREKFEVIRKEIETDCAFQMESSMHKSVRDILGYTDSLINSFLCNKRSESVKENSPLHTLHSFDLIFLLQTLLDSNRNEPLNFKKSAVIIPYKKMLIVQFFSLDKWMKKIEEDKQFVDFHYQNQTDRYFDETDYKEKHNPTKNDLRRLRANWNLREKVWDEICEISSIPSQVGFVYEFIGKESLYNIVESFREKIKTVDFTLSIKKNQTAISNIYDKIVDLGEVDKELMECYIGELFDKNFHKELYILYDTKPPYKSMQELLHLSIWSEIKLTFVEMKDREKFRSPYDINSGASKIETISWIYKNYKRENDELAYKQTNP